MPKAKKYRWNCPECGTGKLLSSRPRKNATARYCLPCSEETGYLVERVSPALERKRAQKTAQRAQRAKRERARTATVRQDRAAAVEAKWFSDDKDMRVTIREICVSIPFLRDRGVTVSRTAEKIIKHASLFNRDGTTGSAWRGSPNHPGSVSLNFGKDYARSWDLALHELLHAIGFKHGPEMTHALLVCARQFWGENPYDHGYDGRGNFGTYNADEVVIKMARAALAREE